MVFGKKKKKKIEPIEETLPQADDETEEIDHEEYKAKMKEMNDKIKALDRKATKAVDAEEAGSGGEFSLDDGEMALAVNALANSAEFKTYQQMAIGQQIAEIIKGYNKVVKVRQNEVQSGEDTEEDLLPTG